MRGNMNLHNTAPSLDELEEHGTEVRAGINYYEYTYKGRTWSVSWQSPQASADVPEGRWIVSAKVSAP